MRRSLFFLILIWGLTLVACTNQAQLTPTATISRVIPEVISHDKPDLIADTQVLRKANCKQGGDDLPWDCAGNNAIAALGCTEVAPVDLFAGLTPTYPVMWCERNAELGDPPNKALFKLVGGMRPRYISYILFRNGKYSLISQESEIKTQSDMQAVFAPIESANEALSYALVVTDLEARYGLKVQDWAIYLVNKIEDTHVEQTADGFVVHLFDFSDVISCGRHTIYAQDVLVTRDGQVKRINREPIYAFDGCAD